MTAKEKEIKKFMEKLHISKEEAEQVWIDDHSDTVSPEVAELEKKAKAMGRRYEIDKSKKRVVHKEKKIDPIKVEVIRYLKNCLRHYNSSNSNLDIVSIAITNEQREIMFMIGDSNYSITLTKHRPEKAQEG